MAEGARGGRARRREFSWGDLGNALGKAFDRAVGTGTDLDPVPWEGVRRFRFDGEGGVEPFFRGHGTQPGPPAVRVHQAGVGRGNPCAFVWGPARRHALAVVRRALRGPRVHPADLLAGLPHRAGPRAPLGRPRCPRPGDRGGAAGAERLPARAFLARRATRQAGDRRPLALGDLEPTGTALEGARRVPGVRRRGGRLLPGRLLRGPPPQAGLENRAHRRGDVPRVQELRPSRRTRGCSPLDFTLDSRKAISQAQPLGENAVAGTDAWIVGSDASWSMCEAGAVAMRNVRRRREGRLRTRLATRA
jgi:hypothetical protein